MAQNCICEPDCDTIWPSQRRRKSRERSAGNRPWRMPREVDIVRNTLFTHLSRVVLLREREWVWATIMRGREFGLPREQDQRVWGRRPCRIADPLVRMSRPSSGVASQAYGRG